MSASNPLVTAKRGADRTSNDSFRVEGVMTIRALGVIRQCGTGQKESRVDPVCRMPDYFLSDASREIPAGSKPVNMWNCPLIPLLFIAVSSLPVPASETPWQLKERRDNIELYAQFTPDVALLWKNIDDVREELSTLLDVSTSGQTVQIILFQDQASYLRYVAPGIPQACRRKAIYYRNGEVSQIYAFQSRSLMTDLRHEMTHALLHQHLPFLPLWLDEGLAEYLEDPAQARTDSSRVKAARWKARTGWRPSLKSLESIPTAEDMDADDYRDSWAWTCFLLNASPETLELLQRYLERIHKGEAPGPFSRFAEGQSPGSLMQANSYFPKIMIRIASGSSRKR